MELGLCRLDCIFRSSVLKSGLQGGFGMAGTEAVPHKPKKRFVEQMKNCSFMCEKKNLFLRLASSSQTSSFQKFVGSSLVGRLGTGSRVGMLSQLLATDTMLPGLA